MDDRAEEVEELMDTTDEIDGIDGTVVIDDVDCLDITRFWAG